MAWLIAVGRLPERRAFGARLKLIVTAGNWPWWLIDSGRIGIVVQCATAESGTMPPVDRRLDVDLVEAVELALHLRQDLQDHVVAVQLREILRHLPLAEGVVERVVDQLRRDAVARGLVAIDVERQGRAWVCWSVATSRNSGRLLQLVQDLRRPVAEFVEIGILQRVLELRARRAAADVDVLRGLQEQPRALRPCRASGAAGR